MWPIKTWINTPIHKIWVYSLKKGSCSLLHSWIIVMCIDQFGEDGSGIGTLTCSVHYSFIMFCGVCVGLEEASPLQWLRVGKFDISAAEPGSSVLSVSKCHSVSSSTQVFVCLSKQTRTHTHTHCLTLFLWVRCECEAENNLPSVLMFFLFGLIYSHLTRCLVSVKLNEAHFHCPNIHCVLLTSGSCQQWMAKGRIQCISVHKHASVTLLALKHHSHTVYRDVFKKHMCHLGALTC